MNKYVSIKLILDRILRHPLMLELSLETAIDYTVDFMRIVGMPRMFETKYAKIDINQYRGILPDDLYQIISVSSKGLYLQYAGGNDAIIKHNESNELLDNTISNTLLDTEDTVLNILEDKKKFEFVTNMNTYYFNKNGKTPTYKIQGNLIYTSTEKKTIDITYSSIKIDDEGYPMILDNSSYLRALELYIKKQWFTILFDMGKIQIAVLQNVQQEYAWAVGDCQSEFNRMTLDLAEAFYKSMRNSILERDHHKYGFNYLGV